MFTRVVLREILPLLVITLGLTLTMSYLPSPGDGGIGSLSGLVRCLCGLPGCGIGRWAVGSGISATGGISGSMGCMGGL